MVGISVNRLALPLMVILATCECASVGMFRLVLYVQDVGLQWCWRPPSFPPRDHDDQAFWKSSRILYVREPRVDGEIFNLPPVDLSWGGAVWSMILDKSEVPSIIVIFMYFLWIITSV